MKCPKCGYLGFERVERCRNCGYEFVLASSAALPDLFIRTDKQVDTKALGEFSLAGDAGAPSTLPGEERATDLPLFGGREADDAPLITMASTPRPPLAVRRATPEVHRVKSESLQAPMLDLGLSAEAPRRTPSSIVLRDHDGRETLQSREYPAARDSSPGGGSRPSDQVGGPEPAGVLARIVSVLIDLTMLAAIDVAVIYFTMQICGLTLAEAALLPKIPLLAFLIVQNGGYLVTFTAGGQTLGKMAMGIRVVSAEPDGSLDLGRSILRTLVWVLLAVPAGLGFVTALLGQDRRGLHDRCAGTRVVRAY